MAVIIVLYIIHIGRSYVRYFNKLESARALKKKEQLVDRICSKPLTGH